MCCYFRGSTASLVARRYWLKRPSCRSKTCSPTIGAHIHTYIHTYMHTYVNYLSTTRSVILITGSGYIKRIGIEEFEAQSRGGKGKMGKEMAYIHTYIHTYCTYIHTVHHIYSCILAIGASLIYIMYTCTYIHTFRN